MSKTTKIEWADSTASPWYGCTKVSPGCANCYIESTIRRMGLKHGQPRKKSQSFERDCRKWNQVCARGICSVCGSLKPIVDRPCICGAAGMWRLPRIFPSLCDWLDNEVKSDWLADFLNVVQNCQNLDFLLLTKRPGLWRHRMAVAQSIHPDGNPIQDFLDNWFSGKPPDNVWIGTSCENQEQLELRANEYIKIPAVKHFLSLEPLLGPLDFEGEIASLADWVIVGGESGKNARPCNVDWIRSIVQQCQSAGVPVFVKQMGSDPRMPYLDAPHDQDGGVKWKLTHPKGGDPAEWPQDLRIRQMPPP